MRTGSRKPAGAVTLVDAREYCRSRQLRDPYRAFTAQRRGASERGIEWELTFDEWWSVWREYFHMRGRGTNELCMGREKDSGPYAIGNVYLTTHLGNAMDYSKRIQGAKRRQEEKEERYWGRKPDLCGPCTKRSPLNL